MSVSSYVCVGVAVMFSFCAMVPLPVEQDMESESDLKAFAVVPMKEACCKTPHTDFVLHTAAHYMSTEQREKTESDVRKEMGELLSAKSAKTCMFSQKCAEFFKSYSESSAFSGLKEYHQSLISNSSSLKVDEPVSLYNLALISGMHIAVFFKYTVWTTRAVSGEVGCSLQFAVMPGGKWVELADMQPGSLAVPQSDDDCETRSEREGVTPTSTVVKVEPGEVGAATMQGSLVDDLLREYEAAFPPTDEIDEVEMKEVVCDQCLLSQPVVVVEKMKLPELGGDTEVHRGCNKHVHPSESHVMTTHRVTRSRSKLKVLRSNVCIENIVQGLRHSCKNMTVEASSVSQSVKRVCSKKPDISPSGNRYKCHAVHVKKCTYCDFSCHSVILFKAHLHDMHKLYVCALATCTSNWVSKGACAAHQELHHSAKFKCTKCDWYHSSKAELEHHLVKHSEQEPWMCKHKGCSRTFKHKGDLSAYSLTHVSGGKKAVLYSCDQCMYSSTQKQYGTYHKRKHEPPVSSVTIAAMCSDILKTRNGTLIKVASVDMPTGFHWHMV